MARILDVFLSSTTLDLEAHRAAIYAELTDTRLFRCQEDLVAQDAGAVDFCRKKVKASDIFIGLTGTRRGWEPDGDNARRSITEMEHDWAKEAGCRRYLYVAPDNFQMASNLRDTDEQYARQQTFRMRVMEGGERIVSQKGFEDPKSFAADIVRHLLTQVITGDLITLLRPELSPQSPIGPDEQRPAIAAAVERLAEDDDVDLLVLAKNPKNIDLADLELKLRERAEKHEAKAQPSLRTSAEYWRHIGALAFLHNTQKALAAYEKAVALDPLEPEGWRYLGELQYRLGEMAKADRSFTRLMELGKSTNDPRAQSISCVRLGWISRDRGDLAKAEALIVDALRFAESAGWQEGVARAYVNLGSIHRTRGDLDKAEETLRKALALYEAMGSKEGLAVTYGNLGNIHATRGDLDKAEEMQRKALALYEELVSKEGMAVAYGNLGNIHETRGDLDKAEEMHRKALALYEELGSKEGMAAACGNLGNIHRTRGNLDKAEEMQRKAFALYEELGSKEGMAAAYGNLGIIQRTRGDLDKAEEMQREALALNEKLGSKEGMAMAYANLGNIYQGRGDKAAMCECWRKEQDLYHQMGLPDRVAEVEKWLKRNKCGES